MSSKIYKIYKSTADFAPGFYLTKTENVRWFALATGCFDCLHTGHAKMLHEASHQLNLSQAFTYPLVVGINSDASVSRIKGIDRPIVKQEDRAFMLAALECVHSVFIFEEDTVVEVLKTLRPAVWVKGGDRTLETLDQEERKTAEEIGTRIVILPRIGEYSTTGNLARMKTL